MGIAIHHLSGSNKFPNKPILVKDYLSREYRDRLVDYNSSSRHTKSRSQGISDQCSHNESFLTVMARQVHSLGYYNTNTTHAHSPISPQTPKGSQCGDLKTPHCAPFSLPFNVYFCVEGKPDTGEDEQISKQLKALERIGNMGRSEDQGKQGVYQASKWIQKYQRLHQNMGQDSPRHGKRHQEKQRQVW
jgi:hypothetical protein